MSFNLATILTETTLAAPDAPAFRFGGSATTYRQLDEQSGRVAAGLRAQGLRPGEVVALQLPNVPPFLTAYFGALRAGLVVLPLNPLLMAPELEYHLGDSAARLLIGFEGMHAEAAKACETLGVPLYLAGVGPAGGSLPEGARPVSELFGALSAESADIEPRDPGDTAVLIYTSGTTGKPKGAELTHFQLYMNCTIAGQLFGYHSDDVTLAVLPFFHVFGLSSVINVAVRYGGCLSIVPRFTPAGVLDALEGDRCTVIGGVPTMLHALAHQDITGRDLSALRVAVSGGASLPEDIMRTFEGKFGIEVLEGYGMSETASSCSFNRPGDTRALSIGKPMWGVTMRVGDAADRPLPPGRENVGEILIRGHNVMKGYLGRPEATAEALRGGWLHSGDLGYMDSDGFYFIVDRAKDLVIRGGYNVYPREIEEVLYAHPDIVEAAVIGKPDERLGEEVVAVVVPRPGTELSADDVIAYTRERLAAYKYPREIRFMAELPKGPSGKILKSALRDAVS
ncbi:MAG TPA: long-chain fatty acid--CoA ligase [Streptosporangiaceae bacterium]|jgi:long-chain acyl-CoA synthetase|nr:long-chain fatty acid--CoA ligase [Streptosporangiaceae bacterium]